MPNWRKVIVSGSDAILNSLEVDSTTQLHGVVNAGVDTDKFLVLDSSNNVDFRTGAQVLSDIGALASTQWNLNTEYKTGQTPLKIVNNTTLTVSASSGVSASLDLDNTILKLSGTYYAGVGIQLKETPIDVGINFDADGATLTTNDADVDHFLINDNGEFKRIAPSDVALSNFDDDLVYGTMDEFFISDGTNKTLIFDNDILTITGSGDISVVESSGTVTISSTGATITGTDTHVLYFDGDDNAVGDAGFTYSKTTERVTIGTTDAGEYDIFSDAAVEGAAKHIIEDSKQLSTNAIYKFGRFDLVGLGRGVGGGGVVTIGIGTGKNTQVPPISYLNGAGGGGSTTIAGDLSFGNLYANVDNNETTLYAEGIEILPGSPGISMRDGSIYFTPSESIEYDISGSKITPKSSASIALDLASDSSSLSISVGRGDLTEVMYVSKSGREPRIGIGTNTPKTALDIYDRKDDGSGTKLLLRTSRETVGGQVGDIAGTINFTIDSGSYNNIETSGSLATISAEVKSISKDGVYGHLKLSTAKSADESPVDLWQMGYEADETNLGINSSVTSGSINIKRSGGSNGGHITLSDTTNNSSIGITTITETISGVDDNFFSFVTASDGVTYDGAIFDYTLKKVGTGVRVGQFMVAWDGSNLEFTDTSAPAIGGADTIQLSASLGINTCILNAYDGDGFTFKALMKKL